MGTLGIQIVMITSQNVVWLNSRKISSVSRLRARSGVLPLSGVASRDGLSETSEVACPKRLVVLFNVLSIWVKRYSET